MIQKGKNITLTVLLELIAVREIRKMRLKFRRPKLTFKPNQLLLNFQKEGPKEIFRTPGIMLILVLLMQSSSQYMAVVVSFLELTTSLLSSLFLHRHVLQQCKDWTGFHYFQMDRNWAEKSNKIWRLTSMSCRENISSSLAHPQISLLYLTIQNSRIPKPKFSKPCWLSSQTKNVTTLVF